MERMHVQVMVTGTEITATIPKHSAYSRFFFHPIPQTAGAAKVGYLVFWTMFLL